MTWWWRRHKEHPVTYTAVRSIARGEICVIDHDRGEIMPVSMVKQHAWETKGPAGIEGPAGVPISFVRVDDICQCEICRRIRDEQH